MVRKLEAPLAVKRKLVVAVNLEAIRGINICVARLGKTHSTINEWMIADQLCSTINFSKDLPLAQGIKFE